MHCPCRLIAHLRKPLNLDFFPPYIGELVLTVLGFLAPWLHLLVFQLPFNPMLRQEFAFFAIALPVPFAAFMGIIALQFAESRCARGLLLGFLTGCVVYSPVWLLLVWFSNGFGI